MAVLATTLLFWLTRLSTGTDICSTWNLLKKTHPAKFGYGCVSHTAAPSYLQNKFIVIFNEGTHSSLGARSVVSKGINVTKIFVNCIDGFSAQLTSSGLRVLVDDPNVALIEQEQEFTNVALQRDPIWNLDRIDQTANSLNQLYDTGDNDGEGVHVYVLDTGINVHDDYAGRLGNGANFISDGRGWGDCNGHGTHCAGTVGGTRWGVAKKTTLHAVRILGCGGSGTSTSVLSGIDWVIKEKSREGWPAIASMSLGSGRSTSINRAVERAVAAGVVVVAAAGNENTDACNSSPASAANAITVGSTTINDRRSSFSNYGSCVDIFAPGSNIRSADFRSRTGSRILSGTSMACPHVAGAAALILSAYPSASPQLATMLMMQRATRGRISNTLGENVFLRTAYGRSDRPAPTPSPSQCITVGGPRSGSPCIFPFTFDSKRYTSCTSDSDPDGRAWCSTLTEQGLHVQGNWGYCPARCTSDSPVPIPTPRPTRRPTPRPTRRPTFRPTRRPTPRPTPRPPSGCRTEQNKPCVFPFKFGRKTYFDCTVHGDAIGRLWCATRLDSGGNYQPDAWGYCVKECETSPVPAPAKPTASTCRILELINEVRETNQLAPLVLDARLQRAAMKHSQDMQDRNYFSHTDPDGLGVDDRMLNEGYPWKLAAENIAVGYRSPEAVVEGWRNSPGHYRNIVCEKCTETGIGVFVKPGSKWTYYYTQVFGTSDDQPELMSPCSRAAKSRTCVTSGGPSPFKPCEFPFRLNGKTHYNCIKHPYQTQAWCPTNSSLFSADPNYAKSWGYCDVGCIETIVACPLTQWWCGGMDTGGQVSNEGVMKAIDLPNLTIHDLTTRSRTNDVECYNQQAAKNGAHDRSIVIGICIGAIALVAAFVAIYMRFCKNR